MTEPVRLGVSVPVVEVDASRCGVVGGGGAAALVVVCTEIAGGFTDCAAVFSVFETGVFDPLDVPALPAVGFPVVAAVTAAPSVVVLRFDSIATAAASTDCTAAWAAAWVLCAGPRRC